MTLTLHTAGAHKFWGNNTGSTAAPGYYTIGAADIPSDLVYNDQANTFGAYLQDFSASTIKLPVAAGASTAAQGEAIYDSTNKNWHLWQNGADRLLIPVPTTFVSGDCVELTEQRRDVDDYRCGRRVRHLRRRRDKLDRRWLTL